MTNLRHSNEQRPLQVALFEAVNAYFKDNNITKTGNQTLYRKTCIILLMHFTSYALFFIVPEPYAWLVWGFHGFTSALVGFNLSLIHI